MYNISASKRQLVAIRFPPSPLHQSTTGLGCINLHHVDGSEDGSASNETRGAEELGSSGSSGNGGVGGASGDGLVNQQLA